MSVKQFVSRSGSGSSNQIWVNIDCNISRREEHMTKVVTDRLMNQLYYPYLAAYIEDSWISTKLHINFFMPIIHLKHPREQGPWIAGGPSLWWGW